MQTIYNLLKVKKLEDLEIPPCYQPIIKLEKELVNIPHEDEKINSIYDEICECIDEKRVTKETIAYLVCSMPRIRPKNILIYASIFKCLLNKYGFDFEPLDAEFNVILNSMGLNYGIPSPCKNYDEILSIYPADTVFHACAWNELTFLEEAFNSGSFDINQKCNDLSLIDIACKYGSDECFMYLKLLGAEITDKTSIYAVEGGNKNIILSLYHDGLKLKNEHLQAAINYHHNEVFEWMIEAKVLIGEFNAMEAIYYGNYEAFLFISENEFEINDTCRVYHFYFTFIILITECNSSI